MDLIERLNGAVEQRALILERVDEEIEVVEAAREVVEETQFGVLVVGVVVVLRALFERLQPPHDLLLESRARPVFVLESA